jgi:hypothetical protein
MTKEEQTLLKYVHCLFPRPNNPNRTTTHLSRSPADQSEQDAINKREKTTHAQVHQKKVSLHSNLLEPFIRHCHIVIGSLLL